MRESFARLQSHAAAEADYLRQLQAAEDEIHAELKAWAEMEWPPFSGERKTKVENEMAESRKSRSGEFEDLIRDTLSAAALDAQNPDEHPADNPNEPPPDNLDGPPPCNLHAHPSSVLVPPPPPGTPPWRSGGADRSVVPPPPPGTPPWRRGEAVRPVVPPPPPPPPPAIMRPVASAAQPADQTEEVEADVLPVCIVEPTLKGQKAGSPESKVVAARYVACLMARHNEAGFDDLRAALSQKCGNFARRMTEGTGETKVEFRALSLLLLIRVGVSSIITDTLIDDNHIDHRIDDNPFGPFVGPSPWR